MTVSRVFSGAGIRVPHDIAIVGYDNNDVSTAIEPELTTIDNRFYDLGHALASNLLALIKTPGERVQTIVPPRLVLRRSHAPIELAPEARKQPRRRSRKAAD